MTRTCLLLLLATFIACATTNAAGVCPAKPTCFNYLKLECVHENGCEVCRCVDKTMVPAKGEEGLPPPSQPPPMR